MPQLRGSSVIPKISNAEYLLTVTSSTLIYFRPSLWGESVKEDKTGGRGRDGSRQGEPKRMVRPSPDNGGWSHSDCNRRLELHFRGDRHCTCPRPTFRGSGVQSSFQTDR